MIVNLEHLAIKKIVPTDKVLSLNSSHSLSPFCGALILVFSELGQFLMHRGRNSPDIVAVGYWLRNTHLQSLKKQYVGENTQTSRIAKGVTFHLAPGNVDTLFFYSMVVSVLCGNQTIMRVSTELTDDAYNLIELVNQFFEINVHKEDHQQVQSLIHIIQYPHDDEITQCLSLLADVRVIWGGNETVNKLSQLPQKLSATTLCFPDRYSVAVIQLHDKSEIGVAVKRLLSDVKPFSQQACSSPKIIYWLEQQQSLLNTQLKEAFWQQLTQQINLDVTLTTAQYLEQSLYQQRLPILAAGYKTKQEKSGVFVKVDVENVLPEMVIAHTGNYVLLQQNITTLDEIELCSHCQTVTMFGIEESHWISWVNKGHQPMKRWVKSGQALVFSHQWDGIDLIESFTTVIKSAKSGNSVE